MSPAWTPPTRPCFWISAAQWAWSFRTRTTRSWPTWWKRTPPSGRKTWAFPPDEIRRRVDEALKAVGMYEYREHAPHLLSGGQKQRVAIAGILAMKPRCVVLDEPTAMLDPIGRKEVLETIRKLNETQGVTVVLITHHMDEAAQAGRLVVMAKGRVIADGPPKEVFQKVEELRAVGLTVPEQL